MLLQNRKFSAKIRQGPIRGVAAVLDGYICSTESFYPELQNHYIAMYLLIKGGV